MARGFNAIVGIVALIAVLWVVFKNPSTKAELAKHVDNVQDLLQNNYMLYFEPLTEGKTPKEVEEMKQHLAELTESYLDYVQNELGSKIKHSYDDTVNGISVQLDLTQKALKKLTQKYSNKADQQQEIMVDKLYELFYTLKGDDLKKWGIKMKLEKDKRVGVW
ncbi:CIC11C00000000239 [Sungouiella intermedia]|uniref:CIC11C00000000239 n=1 Tax=Sungouiella intermedia TaxID=45354 RepID=A0A1L0DUJ0_9ASCO|nr:CIC11C00000002697 [[Candida] intermedia]SGZ56010.1 CIC11C00000000239 [[Candida] intermedia]